MFIYFVIFIVIFAAGWLFFVSAVIYHLREYSLPGWSGARFAIPIFFAVSVIFWGFAVYFLFHIPR